MTTKIKRQTKILNLLKDMGLGVINISNERIATLTGSSESTVKRDINEMADKQLIIRETQLIMIDGSTRKQRDIIIKGFAPKRFTLKQHRNLSNYANHDIYTTVNDEVIWLRRPDGEDGDWERSMPSKEFDSEKKAYSFLYKAVSTHNKSYRHGDRFISRSGKL